MKIPWNKGLNKKSSLSVLKTSNTMKLKKIDNFKKWRDKARETGKFCKKPELKKDGDLAELIGLILGDGSIHKYERTEGLRIVLPTDKPLLIKRCENLVKKVFGKKPSIIKRKISNCVDVRIYQQSISNRLGIKTGARGKSVIVVPAWIEKERTNMIRYLRGLYEAEGSFCVHKPTYTYKLFFTNRNLSLLNNVFRLLKKLGFNPHISKHNIQVSRKEEVYELIKLLRFRKY